MGLSSPYSICPSLLKYQMKKFWLMASVLFEQLLSVPYATVCLCSLYTEQFITYFDLQTFFFKFNTFQPLKLIFRDFSLSAYLVYNLGMFANLELRSSRTKLITRNLKNFKDFSPDTEVIE